MTPVLSISLSGTTATATITATALATVNLYQKATTDSAWVLAGTRSGSGTIVVSGLTAAMQYVFVAVDQTGGVNSFPSNPVIVETAEAADAPDLDASLGDEFDYMLDAWGEQVSFLPAAGGTRAIKAIIDRNIPMGISGMPDGSELSFTVAVKNSTTKGISASEIDLGGDKIQLPKRLGLANSSRRISAIRTQDAGVLMLEVN